MLEEEKSAGVWDIMMTYNVNMKAISCDDMDDALSSGVLEIYPILH